MERVRRIRMSWQRTARDEARIALARLEQAWDAAAASGSAYLMLQIVRLQAEIAGLVRPAGMRRAVLWPVAGEDEFGEMAAGDAPEAGTARPAGRGRAQGPGPGRARARPPLRQPGGARAAGRLRRDRACPTAERLADAIEERERLPVSFEPPAPPPAEDRPQADDPPEETYDEDGWVGDERPSDEDRVDGAENDWLYQRRNGFAELYDPWTPESIELRRRNSLA